MKSNPKKSNPERQGRPIIKRKPTGFFNFNQATGFVLQNKGEILMKISRGQKLRGQKLKPQDADELFRELFPLMAHHMLFFDPEKVKNPKNYLLNNVVSWAITRHFSNEKRRKEKEKKIYRFFEGEIRAWERNEKEKRLAQEKKELVGKAIQSIELDEIETAILYENILAEEASKKTLNEIAEELSISLSKAKHRKAKLIKELEERITEIAESQGYGNLIQ